MRPLTLQHRGNASLPLQLASSAGSTHADLSVAKRLPGDVRGRLESPVETQLCNQRPWHTPRLGPISSAFSADRLSLPGW